jgi:hypothetical protein
VKRDRWFELNFDQHPVLVPAIAVLAVVDALIVLFVVRPDGTWLSFALIGIPVGGVFTAAVVSSVSESRARRRSITPPPRWPPPSPAQPEPWPERHDRFLEGPPEWLVLALLPVVALVVLVLVVVVAVGPD